jgi:hypothetical protein
MNETQERKKAFEKRRSEYREFREILLNIVHNEKHPAYRMKAMEMIFLFDDLGRDNINPYTQAAEYRERMK